jgi:hypothetical protein
MTGQPTAVGRIELRLNSIDQLFHTFDPSPFREGDLSMQAEEYIAGLARELPPQAPIEIVVYLPAAEAAAPAAAQVGPAFATFFARRSRAKADEIRELFRAGRRALAIGLGILSAALAVTWQMSAMGLDGPVSRIIQESVKILGWVSLWRPAEVFFYDWVPIARRRDLFQRLAEATTTIKIDPTHR